MKQIDASWPVMKPKAPSPINHMEQSFDSPKLQAGLEEKQVLMELAKKTLLQTIKNDGKRRLPESAAIEEPIRKAVKTQQNNR